MTNSVAIYNSADDGTTFYTDGAVQETATRADFQQHQAKLSNMLQQFKTELIAEQKQQLDRVFPAFTMPNPEDPTGHKLDIPPSPKLPHDPWVASATLPASSTLQYMSEGCASESSKRFSKDSIFFKCSPLARHSPIASTDMKGMRLSVDDARLSSERTSQTILTNISGEQSEQVSAASRTVPGNGVAKTLSHAASGQRNKKKARFSTEVVQNNTLVTGRYTVDPERVSFESDFTLLLSGATVHIKRLAKRMVKNPCFDVACGILICFNAVLVGVETEFLGQQRDVPTWCDATQLFLNSWYVIELCLRLLADGYAFCRGDEANWNLFDVVLVVSAGIDLVLTNIQINSFGPAGALRALRLFRIVRTLRIIRQFKYVREFRKMVCSLTSSLSTLFWSMLLVFGVMYSFAVWFTQTAAYYRIDNVSLDGIRKADDLDEYYTSLSRTFYTLFASISGGYSWHEVADPWVSAEDPYCVILFFVYISISVFGLLNIVTSVFVESAMSATKHFQDLLLDEKKKDLEMYTHHMQRIFHVIDADGGGEISFKEMRMFLNDASSELPAYLEALGITSSDVWVLFKLLDVDGSGSIDVDEFCEGCMRLKGEARSFDINCMMYESRAMMRHLADFMEFVEDRLDIIERETASWLLEVDRRAAMRMSVLTIRPPPIASRQTSKQFENSTTETTPIAPSTPRDTTSSARGGVSTDHGDSRRINRRQASKPKIFQETIENDPLACRTRDFQ